MLIHTDCKYYCGNKPCRFHKIDKRLCEGCNDYKKIKERILIIKLEALGDVLRTTSILPSLKEKYPDSHVTWITKSDASVLLKNNKYIDRILQYDNNYLSYVLNEKFDLGICLDAENSSATILSVSDCREKLGFIVNNAGQLIPANEESTEWYYMGLNDEIKKANRETYQKLIYKICKLKDKVHKPLFELDEEAVDYAKMFREKYNLDKSKYVIGINTGGGSRWECKKWIKEYYTELIEKLNRGTNRFTVILFGGEKEKELIGYIKENITGDVIDAGCYDSVSKFAGIINLTDIFLTPDSLGFHISIALNKYTFVMVGPTSPWELDVYGNGEIIFNDSLDCLACYDAVCSRNKECMSYITPEMIYKKIIKRIEEVSNS